jgi:hypothetical protein
MLAWRGAPDLDAAIAPVGCGCDLARRAARDPDPAAREALGPAATLAQQRWGCPRAGHTPPAPLDDGCREVLTAVATLTGTTGCATCPLAGLGAPWVARAARAHAWREHGELRAVEPVPSAALIDAIDRIDQATGDRYRHEREARDREREARDRTPPTPARTEP